MQTIRLDICHHDPDQIIPVIWAKQGDVGRKFKVILSAAGEDYIIPSNVSFCVWYSGPSGSGNYSSIGSESAFRIDGNILEVELISQMLCNPGGGQLCLTVNDTSDDLIGTWDLLFKVQPTPGANSEAAQTYYTAFSETADAAIDAAARAEKAAASLQLDTGLSVSGRAADAAATGTALAGKLPGVESASFPGCFYRTVNGVTEWLNPPMVLDTEYRTTERHRGKPVYTQLINCGPITHGKSVSISTSFTVIRRTARSDGYIPYPYQNYSSNYYRDVIVEYGKITMLCGSSAAGTENVYVQIWYTKA